MQRLLGGHIVVKVMEREGVKKAFCVPGESYLGVIDGLYQHPTIDLISARHEGGASFMADAYAKASGNVGVCMATRGPGATNLSIGLYTAMQDSTPLVALICQVKRSFIGKGAFQEVDFRGYFKHLCKWSVEINDVNRIPELLHRAFYEAKSGRPGPVVVSLPHDILKDITNYEGSKPINFNRPIADKQTIAKVINKIEQAKKPFIIAGGGVIASNAQSELESLSEMLNLPVASAFRRFNVISNYHKNYAGWLGFDANEELIKRIKESDLVIALGTKLSQISTQDYTLLGDKPNVIQIDICESSIGKAYEVELGVVSDAKIFLQIALSLLKRNNCKKRIEVVKKCNDSYVAHSTPPSANGTTQYTEMNSIMKDIMEAVPENAVLTSDAGNFYGWLARYFRFIDSKQYIGPTSGAMGYGLPGALGAKLALPDHTVISFSSDRGFMMMMSELETAVRNELNIIVIIINNNGTIRAHQEKHFPNRIISTQLTNPSFVEIAKKLSCNGVAVAKNEDFLPAFHEALHSEKPYVIEIMTDPSILSVGQVVEQ